MSASVFSLSAYCHRIDYHGSLTADIATVTALMRHQLRAVAFENLDAFYHQHVSFDLGDISEKILKHNRGGYCYELNGLFSLALEALGIRYQFVACRPMFYHELRPQTHMAIVCCLGDRQYLCDLGFGSYGIRQPMALSRLNTEIQQDDDRYKLSPQDGADYPAFILKALDEGQWKAQYAFDLSPRLWIDFMPANYFNSSHPDSLFVQKLFLVIYTDGGRKVLFGDKLKCVEHAQVTQRHIPSDELQQVIAKEFKISYTTKL